jgi:hypothetical protein
MKIKLDLQKEMSVKGRYYLAKEKNPDMPSEFLANLAIDKYRDMVRQEVAKNPNTSSETLAKLAEDINE